MFILIIDCLFRLKDPGEGTSTGIRKRGRPRLTEEEKAMTPAKRACQRRYEYHCDKCTKGFATLRLMRQHRYNCFKCGYCGRFSDWNHLERCRKQHEQGTYREPKGSRILCSICDRFRAKSGFRRHMKQVHKVEDYKRREHPEDLSEVNEVFLCTVWIIVAFQFKLFNQP